MKIEFGGNYSKFSDLKPGDVYGFPCSENVYLCYKMHVMVGHINLSTSQEYYPELTYDAPVIIYKDAKLVIGKE